MNIDQMIPAPIIPAPRRPTEDVFKPSTVPNFTYVERGEEERRLAIQLKAKGRPICVEGPYRSGKTSLVITKVTQTFARHIHVLCKKSTTFDGLLLQAFDELGPFYSESVEGRTTKLPSGLSGEFLGLKAQLGGKGVESKSVSNRALPPQLNSRSLAKYSCAADAPLIIDDAHKLPDLELAQLAEAMREWQTLVLDVGTPKMVVISSDQGGSSMASRLIEAAPDLNDRLASITTTLMTETELHHLIQLGEKELNIDLGELSDQIVELSFGFPGVCQDLCYQACMAADIVQAQESKFTLSAEHLETALKEYLTSCAHGLKRAFDHSAKLSADSINSGFFATVCDAIASKQPDGSPREQLISKVAASLSIDPKTADDGLVGLADDELGVLRIDPTSSLVQFKAPLYLVFYKRGSEVTTALIKQRALVKSFLEIVNQSQQSSTSLNE